MKKMRAHQTTLLLALAGLLVFAPAVQAQTPPTGIEVPVFSDPIMSVDFSRPVRDWDGFGVNYVETSQTRDYDVWPQEYGGFSILTEGERQEILDMIFGDDGLKPSFTKMFLGSWHEGETKADNDNDDPWDLNMEGFDHERTTKWMRYFNHEGLERTRARGDDLEIVTTLYGPAPWMTEQKFLLGPYLDQDEKLEMAEYMVSWVKFLKDEENLPVKYLSLHNEGDAYYRWPRDGSLPGEDHRDFNLLWRPDQVVEYLKILRPMLDKYGLQDVGITPGETQNWYRFHMWGYAPAIVQDAEALENLAIITSHSFANWENLESTYYGDWRSNGIDMIREEKPDMRAWVTSMSWGDMDARFVDAIRRNIYMSKVNGLLPWATVQRVGEWVGGDPNPGTAFKVNPDGTYEVMPGYYFYKQVTRAGQPGMKVAHVESYDPDVNLLAWSSNGTDNPDAFVVVNIEEEEKEAVVHVRGTDSDQFTAYRTSDDDRYEPIGSYFVNEKGEIHYTVPPNSATTFFAE